MDSLKASQSTADRERLKHLLTLRAAESSSVTRASSSIIPIRETGSKTPLYCIHGGGGGLRDFKRLTEHLIDDRPVYGLQTTGMTVDDPILRSVEKLAEIHFMALMNASIDGPVILCGHSIGATIAYELAQQLIRSGKPVKMLVLIDQPGPDVKVSTRLWLYWQWAAISHLPWRQKIAYIGVSVRYRIQTNKWIPSFVRQMFYSNKGKGKPEDYITGSRAGYRRQMNDTALNALKEYTPNPYHNLVALFRAKFGTPRLHTDPWGGWGNVTDRKIQVFEIPGKHMNIFQMPHIAVLAEKLDSCIAESEKKKV